MPGKIGRSPLPSVEFSDRSHKEPNFLDLVPETLDPSRHYRWVRCRADEHHMAVTKAKLLGYTIETNREGGPQTVTQTDGRPDTSITVGDLLLMSCSKDVFERREIQRKARQEALMESATAQTKEMAREKGVRIIADPDHDGDPDVARRFS